jgi:bacteriocin biosynthesis cyclodehydratase domain-containing protein
VIPALPYLAPWYRVARDDDKVVLEYGQRLVCLEGRAAGILVPVLLPLLDGTRTVDEIVALLGEPVRPAIEQAIGQLDEHDVLVDGPPLDADLPHPVAQTAELLAALHPGAVRADDAAAALAGSRVSIVGSDRSGVELARLLRQSAIQVEHREAVTPEAALVVSAPAPSELPELRTWNRQALDLGQPWLQVLPFDGRYASVGPLYLPEETCCYECFRLRRTANLDGREELALLEESAAPYPSSPALHTVVAGLAAVLCARWLVLRDHYVPSAFYAIELLPVLRLTLHHVHRVPRCPACSGLATSSAPLPWHKEAAVVDG